MATRAEKLYVAKKVRGLLTLSRDERRHWLSIHPGARRIAAFIWKMDEATWQEALADLEARAMIERSVLRVETPESISERLAAGWEPHGKR